MALPTGGFARATVMPNPGLLDPRLFTTDYGAMARGIGEGMQLQQSFANNRQLALDRADANSLRDLRLAAQRGQLELEPQLQQNNLALSNRRALEARLSPIELESTQNIALQNRYGAPTTGFATATTPEELEAGILGTYTSTPNKLPGQDVVMQEQRIVFDPVTQQQRIVRSTKQALQTAEQIANVQADNDARIKQIEAMGLINDLRADSARIQAEAAKLRAESYAKSVEKGGQPPVTPDLVFNRRNAQNLADLDETLGLGSVERIQQFGATPVGRTIIDAISISRTSKLPLRLSPEQQGFLQTFRTTPSVPPAVASAAITNMADQAVAPGSAITAAINTLPAAAPAQAASQPPASAIQYLRANPSEAAAFEQKYGVSATQYLQP